MLSPKAQYNLKNAKQYFREHLRVGDYYAEEHVVQGEWFGRGAEKIGLRGVVNEADFVALCEGNHPVTGERCVKIQPGLPLEKSRQIVGYSTTSPLVRRKACRLWLSLRMSGY